MLRINNAKSTKKLTDNYYEHIKNKCVKKIIKKLKKDISKESKNGGYSITLRINVIYNICDTYDYIANKALDCALDYCKHKGYKVVKTPDFISVKWLGR